MRSAVSSERVGAVTRATSSPGADPVAVGDEVLDVGGRVAAHRVDRRGGDGEPGDDAVARGWRTCPTLRWSAGTVATDVTSTPPIRSSATAIRDEGGDGVGVEAAVEQAVGGCPSDSGWKTNIRPHLDDAARRRRRAGRRGAAATRRAARGSRTRRWQPRLSRARRGGGDDGRRRR